MELATSIDMHNETIAGSQNELKNLNDEESKLYPEIMEAEAEINALQDNIAFYKELCKNNEGR